MKKKKKAAEKIREYVQRIRLSFLVDSWTTNPIDLTMQCTSSSLIFNVLELRDPKLEPYWKTQCHLPKSQKPKKPKLSRTNQIHNVLLRTRHNHFSTKHTLHGPSIAATDQLWLETQRLRSQLDRTNLSSIL